MAEIKKNPRFRVNGLRRGFSPTHQWLEADPGGAGRRENKNPHTDHIDSTIASRFGYVYIPSRTHR